MELTELELNELQDLLADLVNSGRHGDFLRRLKEEDDMVFGELSAWFAELSDED